MLNGYTPEQFLHRLFLLAVQDGAERVVCRPTEGHGCGMAQRIAGQSYDMVPPPLDLLQQLPAALAWMGRNQMRWFWRLGLLVRRPRHGRFQFPIGSGSVLIAYHTHWETGRVAELEISFGLAPHLATTATEMLSPPVPEGFEHIDE